MPNDVDQSNGVSLLDRHILTLSPPVSRELRDRGNFPFWFLLSNWPCWASAFSQLHLTYLVVVILCLTPGDSASRPAWAPCRSEECTQKLWSTFLGRMHGAAGWYEPLSAGYWGSLLCSTVYAHGCFLAFPDPAWMTQCNDIKDRLAKWNMLALPLPRASVFILLWPFPLATCRYIVFLFLFLSLQVECKYDSVAWVFYFVFIISPMSPLSPHVTHL